MNNVLNSYWGVELKPNVIDNGSDVLAVVLPGIGYTLDRVTMEYSSQLVLELGYDLIEIEYGFQVGRKAFNVKDEFNIIADESFELVNDVLKLKKYKKIIIIGKSIGTCVQNFLNEKLNEYNITNVYISPINKTVEMGLKGESLVITGSADPLLSKDNLDSLAENDNYKIVLFDEANHALNIERNPMESLEIQMEIIKAIDLFIR